MSSERAIPDFEAEGLLDGVDGEAREGRRELLEELFAQGVSLDDLRRAAREGRLPVLLPERVLTHEPKYTIDELAAEAGVDAEDLIAQRRAGGLPVPERGERAFSDEDLEAARRYAASIAAGLSPDAMLAGARLFGRAAAQAAEAAMLLGGTAFLEPGDTELDAARRYAEAARYLHPQTVKTLQYLYDAHFLEQLRNAVVASDELESGRLTDTSEVAVCFADLVGFTRIGQELSPVDLGEVALRFSEIAADVAEPPVTLVKMIGDAAMMVSPDPVPLLESALDLIDAIALEGEDFPQLRAGVAMGEALNRWGDWYGMPVNVASRVAAIARASSVLATREVRDAAGDRFQWSFAGRSRLRGLRKEVSLYRCRRPIARPGAAAPE